MLLLLGDTFDTSLRRRVEFERMVVAGCGRYGACSDGNAGDVEQRIIPETITVLYARNNKTL